MSNTLIRFWWVQVLRGVIAVLLGITAFAWPHWTAATLGFLFGAYVFADGIFALVAAAEPGKRWWAQGVEGVAGILAGLVAFLWPSLTALALMYLIAAWAVVTGTFQLVAAIRIRQAMQDEFFLGLSGVAAIIFGTLLMLWPQSGALALLWLIGGFALVYGAIMIVLGFKLRTLYINKPSVSGTIRVGTFRTNP